MGILKKIKKGLKKVAKPALGIGAALLAARALKGKGIDSGLSAGKKFLMSGAAGGARLPKAFSRANMRDIAGSGDVMPGNLSNDMGQKRKQFMPGVVDYMAKGGRAGKKTKPKSIGKALRGGGKVIR